MNTLQQQRGPSSGGCAPQGVCPALDIPRRMRPVLDTSHKGAHPAPDARPAPDTHQAMDTCLVPDALLVIFGTGHAPPPGVQPSSPVPLFSTRIHCRRPELPVADRLTHFSFWREVIQVDHWVLKIVCHGYSIELLQTPQFLGALCLHQLDQTSCPKRWMIC